MGREELLEVSSLILAFASKYPGRTLDNFPFETTKTVQKFGINADMAEHRSTLLEFSKQIH